MKRLTTIAIFGVTCCLAGTLIRAAETASEEETLVAAEVNKMYKVTSTATRLTSPALKKVTDAAIYDVKVKITGPQSSSSSSLKVIRRNKAVTTLRYPSTNQLCPWLKTMIKKTFRLQTEENAKALEAALDVLYPLSDSFGGRDKKAKAIRREGRSVTFVRGVFFKNLKGFVFEADENGSIVNVSYSLRVKPAGPAGGGK